MDCSRISIKPLKISKHLIYILYNYFIGDLPYSIIPKNKIPMKARHHGQNHQSIKLLAAKINSAK